ncbi:hypothetical protein [Desulfomonile tiedjei]|uniref:Uncharacterized protein n=1 Tax=Desulfomonile tiedjei (strain ATCC 49306 / DSM 6799 / DCB-1) TaxID=706587 RepID=I4C7Z9_DESTA|nr:hypothetical protein [Desulfomonile tiedjei]AFM25690.1 hypothetical protein Desti_3026 [Desulfomonile tiedjei DSM 6799]
MADSSSRDTDRNFPGGTQIDPTIVDERSVTKSELFKGIPRGIEVLIKKASVDPEFRSVLLAKRSGAAVEIELELSNTETVLLNAIPKTQIQQIIENVSVPGEHRRAFLGKVAGAMLAVLGIPLSARAWEFTRWSSIEFRHNYTIRNDLSEPMQFPAFLSQGNWLKCKIAAESKHWLALHVRYSCPFPRGVIDVTFAERYERSKPDITFDPSSALVSFGKGEVTFYANGKNGFTDRIFVRLRNLQDEGTSGDPKFLDWPPQGIDQPGEHVSDNQIIWRMLKHVKVWPEDPLIESSNRLRDLLER